MGAQEIDVRLEGVDLQRLQRAAASVGGAEAAQALERRERADQFGLVVGVLVVALRRVERDAGALLVRVPLPRLGEVGVDLEGQGGAGGEQLEQEGQARPEPRDGGAAEFGRRVGGDQGATATWPGAPVEA